MGNAECGIEARAPGRQPAPGVRKRLPPFRIPHSAFRIHFHSAFHIPHFSAGRPVMEGQTHPSVGTYLRVFAVLVMVTVIEVGVFYVPAFQAFLVPILLVLSGLKFMLVVMFYMHLKTDRPFYTFVFGAPLMLATAVMVALLFLFYGSLRLRAGG